jgi:hypothetical protein
VSTSKFTAYFSQNIYIYMAESNCSPLVGMPYRAQFRECKRQPFVTSSFDHTHLNRLCCLPVQCCEIQISGAMTSCCNPHHTHGAIHLTSLQCPAIREYKIQQSKSIHRNSSGYPNYQTMQGCPQMDLSTLPDFRAALERTMLACTSLNSR